MTQTSSLDVYLVIGGDVLVGRHVVQQLKARGDTVFVFDSTQRHDDVECFSGDICDPDDLSRALQKTGATCIIHTMTPISVGNNHNPSIFHRVNVEGTKCVIAAAKAAGVRKLVYFSSSSTVFDGRPIENGDETLPYPRKTPHPYATSKVLAEQNIIAANDPNALRTVVIRSAGLFGPMDKETIFGAYDSWQSGTTHVQLGDNKNLFDNTCVENVAHAILLASAKLDDPEISEQVAGQVFFVTNQEPRPFWDFMRALWAGFDTIFPDRSKPAAKKPVVIPRWMAFVMAYISQFIAWIRGDKNAIFTPYAVSWATTTVYFNCAKARRVLGYEPQVSVEEGIRRTMAWFKEEYDSGRVN
ncbi:NAD(P)-binding protein [Favolaschia claudopus]|uniref:NAD(P)-binding protein n=1 Tax=Favolaschia claudopus TaxID=2862362 RepID=A0AAW0C0H4_9AGAR